jgi:CRP-like cAMP-binding protein
MFKIGEEIVLASVEGPYHIKLTQKEIADLIGISRAVACQLISELVDEGFIDRKGKTYIIHKKHLCSNLLIMSKWKEC